jgi:RNA polymerase sigma-70 factor (ECF subfamily)
VFRQRPRSSEPAHRGEHESDGPDGEIREAADASLVVAVGRFREDALAELYRRHASSVLGLARRLLGDPTVAEEVVQEVFLRLWRSPERFDPGRGSLRSYLLAQTHGRAVDLLRSERARRQREEREALATPEASYDLEREVWNLTVAERVQQAMTTLTDDERQAIELAYFRGHTYREVAALLDAPEGTVKSRIRTGLVRMRAVLAEAGVRGS